MEAALSYSRGNLRPWRIEPVGDRCLLVRFGDRVEPGVNHMVLAFAAALEQAPLKGVVDIVPAFTTIAVHYLPQAYAAESKSPYTCLGEEIEGLLQQEMPELQTGTRVVEIPACYGGEFGPDLDEVAQRCGMTPDQVIAAHAASPLVVYTFFFAPGAPFAGGLDPRLAVPRRPTPRTLVPAGSVAIANGLSMVYELAMPGGWNLIARTPWRLFDVKKNPPVRLELGDSLRFVPISPSEFARLEEKAL